MDQSIVHNGIMNNYYIQTNIICVLVLIAVYVVLHNKRGALSTRRRSFTRLLIITMILSLSDIVSWVFNGATFIGADTFVHAGNMIYYASVTIACYQWLDYVCLRTNVVGYNHNKRKIISAIPLIIMLSIIIVNPITHWLFKVENNIYQRANGVYIHWIISWGYLIAATIIVARQILKTPSKSARKKLRPVLLFAVPSAIAAILQMIFFGMTAMQCGITLGIIMITFGYMNEEISRDDLTDLNNRSALEYYINDKLQKGPCAITVLMCDIDGFKSINDTMGHATGDMALKKIANILKSACSETVTRVFLCRYGGDEFIICGVSLTEMEIESLKNEIDKKLIVMNSKREFDIPLTISVGQASGICSIYDDVEKLTEVADKDMYYIKKLTQKER